MSSSKSCKKARITAGEIDHSEICLSQLAELCFSKEFSDVTFVIEDDKIYGHVNILVTRCKYFRALMCGKFDVSKQIIINLQLPKEAFKALLKYIYSGHLSLSQMREEIILDTLRLVNQCECTELELSIAEYLCDVVSLDNVCAILDTARVLSLEKLQDVCLAFLDANAYGILAHYSFKNLSEEMLKVIVSRDTFCAPEVQIFISVREWCTHNSNVATESVMSLVRLPLLSVDHLFEVVRNFGVSDSTLLDAINEKRTSTSLPFRIGSWKEENFVTDKFGARVTQSEYYSALLNGDTKSYDLKKGNARHSITDSQDLGIVFELGSVTCINNIKLRLLDHDSRYYSYFIDVSVDKTQWKRIVDHRAYHCRSWQFLYFPLIAVRYIKLVGTYGSKQPMFEIVSLAAYCRKTIPNLIDGVVVPSQNVAIPKMGAIVVPDDNTYYPENLLNGNIIRYDINSGYTGHSIGKGSIMVQLGQPYMIGSMRLLLWDFFDRSYSYYIEASINQKDWKVIVDNQNGVYRSWQNIAFEPRAMVFIKIVGKSLSTESKLFACVHFECPSKILTSN